MCRSGPSFVCRLVCLSVCLSSRVSTVEPLQQQGSPSLAQAAAAAHGPIHAQPPFPPALSTPYRASRLSRTDWHLFVTWMGEGKPGGLDCRHPGQDAANLIWALLAVCSSSELLVGRSWREGRDGRETRRVVCLRACLKRGGPGSGSAMVCLWESVEISDRQAISTSIFFRAGLLTTI